MEIKLSSKPCFSCLTLADGKKYLLRPTDPQSVEIVARISDVMHLSLGSDGREIFICVSEHHIPENISREMGPFVCSLSPEVNEVWKAIQMSQLAHYIALQTMPHGCMLIHGALIRHQGQGIILAAPGGIGKSTACNRLPESWEALSDDATLVVPTGDGRYYAHPWPTWSRFFFGGPGGAWNVEEAIPLSSIFFLQQSTIDQVVPLPKGDATSLIVESIRQVMQFPLITDSHTEKTQTLLNICLSSAEQLINSVSSNILQISLEGAFWEEIAETLLNPGELRNTPLGSLPSSHLDSSCRFFDDKSIPIIYSGPSMYPTFHDADLLKVIPYEKRDYQVGDVICFSSPEKNKYIIHRIIALHQNGIQTRGDNNSTPDSSLVKPDNIIGKVVTVSRASGTKVVTGGKPGIIRQKLLLTQNQLRIIISFNIYPLIKKSNPAGFFLPLIWHCFAMIIKPRYILFTTRNSHHLKLFIGGYLVGEFNTSRGLWNIRPIFSLLIDKSTLPTKERPGSSQEIRR